jgi:hypothetical protein
MLMLGATELLTVAEAGGCSGRLPSSPAAATAANIPGVASEGLNFASPSWLVFGDAVQPPGWDDNCVQINPKGCWCSSF